MIVKSYLPENVLSNNDLVNEFPSWDHIKFEKTVGIKERRIVDKTETALDLAFKACEKILLNFNKEKIDFLILCTQSPDYFLPTSACILQDRLGLSKDVGAFDFNLGCSGYVYGLSIVKGLLLSNQCENVLLVMSETYSKLIHPKDRTNRSLFGDGAAATIVTKNDALGIGSFVFGTDGSGSDNLIVKNGASRNKGLDLELKTYGSNNTYTNSHLYMNGPDIFNFTLKNIPSLVKNCAIKNSMEINDIDYFIFHQANSFMLNVLRKKLKIDENKFYNDLEKTGNTVSATIPLALENAINTKKINDGDKIMLVGFGVGLSMAAVIIKL